MLDFSKITEELFVGEGFINEEDELELREAGITHIIDARAKATSTRLIYLHNPTDDDGLAKAPEWFWTAISFAARHRRSNFAGSARRLYICCTAGINRSPSLAYAILRFWGMTAEQAETILRRARPVIGLRYKADADFAMDQTKLKS